MTSLNRMQRHSGKKVPVKVYGGQSRELPQRKMPGGPKQPKENQTSLLPHFAFPIDQEPLPALTESLFSNIPPKLNFVLKGQTGGNQILHQIDCNVIIVVIVAVPTCWLLLPPDVLVIFVVVFVVVVNS